MVPKTWSIALIFVPVPIANLMSFPFIRAFIKLLRDGDLLLKRQPSGFHDNYMTMRILMKWKTPPPESHREESGQKNLQKEVHFFLARTNGLSGIFIVAAV